MLSRARARPAARRADVAREIADRIVEAKCALVGGGDRYDSSLWDVARRGGRRHRGRASRGAALTVRGEL